MNADALRDVLKSGPLAGVYARLRRAKRRLRREPVAGPLLPENTPLDAESLRHLVPLLPDHARLLYSLGLQYLKQDRPEDLPKALACLRSAETIGFESPERVTLYKALVEAKLGRVEEAQRQIMSLVSYELTVEEDALREDISQNRVRLLNPVSPLEPPGFADEAGTVLVVGDVGARSAGWSPGAWYLLADAGVTGMTLAAVAVLKISFDSVWGPPEMRGLVSEAGLTAACWRDI